ncbi:glycosyltransferase family 4 protein [Pseudomonas veronii]|uniref:glycosyltransferase family 4 protein n=1 Tax=Pseudomonas veronii TaxID=76761 RepID=UPI002D76A485|nr:glycosyltransferase family 4 protein [Pseudomonas veronii]WRU65249.1 glycosyltransferase family 4 protein [Pseudomonas veronii]
MRIQHLIHTPRYSGAEVLVASLTLAHNKLGHNSNVASFAPAESDFERVIQEQEAHDIKWETPKTALRGMERINHFRYAQNKFKPDVIFAHTAIPAAYARAGFLKNIIPVLHAENNYPRGSLAAAEHLLQYLAKGVIHISPLAGSLYSTRFTYPPTICIPNGIDLNLINSFSEQRENLRTRFGFNNATKVLIQAGRICRIKGQHLSLQAIAPLLKSKTDVHLLLAGLVEDQDYQNELQQIVIAEGIQDKVHFLGARGDIPSLLHAADVFLMPSKQEAQGIALVEALAAGLPIVASDINGFQFSRNFDGVRLVKTECKTEYSEAINEFTAIRRRYCRNLDGYDIADTATAYIEFAKKCIY